MEIITVHVTPVQQNCRILIDGQDAIVVDPGGDFEQIMNILTERNLNLNQIWLTHSHFDHCGAVADLKKNFPNTPLIAHPIERDFRALADKAAASWGIFGVHACPEPDIQIADDSSLQWKHYEVKVLFTPGHSPGHLVYYFPAENLALCGDTVFKGSIGRTDLPGSDYSTLIRSIREKILTLPSETKLLPGHGDDTTVDSEKLTNPFLNTL